MASFDDIGIAALNKFISSARNMGTNSLVEYTSVCRVEPSVIIGLDCIDLEVMPHLMQNLTNIFSGIYFQAWNLSINIGRIDVREKLDALQPKRKPIDSAIYAAGHFLNTESYKFGLPSLEAFKDEENTQVRPTREVEKILNDINDLSVGKLINLEISDGMHTGIISVNVRLMVSSIPTEQITILLSDNTGKKTAKDNYYGYMTGRLKFIRDIVFCDNAVKEHKKKLLADKSGAYAKIMQTRLANATSTMVSLNPSLATISNMLVISDETLKNIERNNIIKFNNFSDREKVLKDTLLMMVVVLDKEWQVAKIYYKGIDDVSELKFKDLEKYDRGSGPNITEVLNAYKAGSAPIL